MSGLVIAYAHWKTNAVGSRYPPCTCRFSNGTTLCLHSGAAHLFRLFFSQFCKISQISCEFVHFVLISPLQTANAEFGRLSPSTRALICFATKCPHGQAVKTSPSHGGIWGSIPHGGTKKSTRIECFFIFHFYFFIFHSPPCLIAHLVCATLLPEPQNTGLTLHYVSKLTRFRYFTIPHGGTKKTSPLRLVFFIRCLQRHVINACVVCNCNRCVSPMSHCTLCVRNFVARNIFSSV